EREVSDPTILTSLLDSAVIGDSNGYSDFRIGTHIDDADADFSSDSEDDDDLREEDDDQDVCPQSVADAQSSFEKSEEEQCGEPTVDPGLAEDAKRMRQQELDACAASETGDPLSLNSMKSYRTYLNFYKKFCNQNYLRDGGHRFDVKADKVVLFFKNVMFHRTARMYFYQNQYRDVQTAVRLPEGSNVLVRNNTVDLAEGRGV
ncbi:hypothetical protein BGZ82_004317, partial [Podila clonocystis]